jgi:toxin ParE1/3/4
MVEIRWTAESETWLSDIFNYIAKDDRNAATKVINGIYKKAQTLKQFPDIGYVYRFEKEGSIRILLYGHYRIAYLHKEESYTINVLGVFHGSLKMVTQLKGRDMMIEKDTLSAKLCIKGIQAEFEHKLDDARNLYRDALNTAIDDYDSCIAAHYIAHLEENPESALKWNLEALARAQLVNDNRVEGFYASLFVNIGKSFELLGDLEQAQHYYTLAKEHGLSHEPDYISAIEEHIKENVNGS